MWAQQLPVTRAHLPQARSFTASQEMSGSPHPERLPPGSFSPEMDMVASLLASTLHRLHEGFPTSLFTEKETGGLKYNSYNSPLSFHMTAAFWIVTDNTQ